MKFVKLANDKGLNWNAYIHHMMVEVTKATGVPARLMSRDTDDAVFMMAHYRRGKSFHYYKRQLRRTLR